MTRKLERREFLGLAAAAPLLLGDLSSAQRTAAPANRAAQRFGMESLLDTGYDGWVMIELDRAPAAEIDAVKHNLDYMTKTLGLKLGQPSAKSAR